MMKRSISRLLALVLTCAICLMGCSTNSILTGNYQQDALATVSALRTAIELPENSPEKAESQAEARQIINEFVSRYRRNNATENLSSFTTMRTALNSLAGHYSSYGNRPLPEKLKARIEYQFKQVEAALKRGA